jgi:hypothetical protein
MYSERIRVASANSPVAFLVDTPSDLDPNTSIAMDSVHLGSESRPYERIPLLKVSSTISIFR